MKEPSVFHYTLLVFVSLVFAVAGLYLLANFSRLLRNSIKNELLRKNVAAMRKATVSGTPSFHQRQSS